jgi:hypothetical protein
MDHSTKSPVPFCQKPVDEHRRLLLDLGMTPAAAEAAIGIDAHMGHIRRSMARRELGRMALRDL